MLRQVVDGLAARPEVAGVAVVSGDGLVIEQALHVAADRDAIAALATTLTRHGRELGAAARLGNLGAAVLEYTAGPAIIRPLHDGASLVVLGRPDADLGELLYLLRRHHGALADLL
ncbi:MAG TPA: roadblock/LC7 domain-containing protein [Gemmatimonadales bacterium]